MFALLLIIISFAVVISSEYAQKNFVDSYNTSSDCDFVSNYTDYSVIYWNLQSNITNSNGKAQLNCFCYKKMEEMLADFKNFKLIDPIGEQINPCDSWLTEMLKYQSLNVGLIIVISILNSLIILGLTFLTKFERNMTLTIDMYKNMFKCFIIQFINTAVVIMVVNINIQSLSQLKFFFIFAGQYKDLNPQWYNHVGSVIAFAMFINIFTPHLSEFLSYIFVSILRILDKGYCSKHKRFTKKLTKKDYLQLYVGPEFGMEFRYAEILNSIFVTLFFSSGIPILYSFICIFLFLNYWVDKILLLKFYRTPPQYDIKLSKYFNLVIIMALIIHLCFGIWVYGNDDILTSDNTPDYLSSIQSFVNNLSILDNSIGYELKRRISLPHNLVLFLLLLIIIIFSILKLIVFDVLKIICSCCITDKVEVDNNENTADDIVLHKAIQFDNLYDQYQIRKLKIRKFLRKEKQPSNYYENLMIQSFYLDRYYLYTLLNEESVKINKGKLISDFEQEIMRLKEENKRVREVKMKGDISYDIAFNSIFQEYAYNLYLQEAEINTLQLTEAQNGNKKVTSKSIKKVQDEDAQSKDMLRVEDIAIEEDFKDGEYYKDGSPTKLKGSQFKDSNLAKSINEKCALKEV